MNKINTDHVSPYRTGGELYRVILSETDGQSRLIRRYEVWATIEAIEDGLRINGRFITQKDAVDFAERVYLKRKKDLDGQIPINEGAFVTSKSGIRYGDYYTFPGSMSDPDIYVQTNISLPTSLHKWLKFKAVEDGKSISEVIRLALDEYRKK